MGGHRDRTCMNRQTLVLILTAAVVACLGAWFVLASWDHANRVATVLSALGALAAIGVAIWAALRGSSVRSSINAKGTGDATAMGSSSANTGIRVSKSDHSGRMEVKDTGKARADDGGDANSGIDQN